MTVRRLWATLKELTEEELRLQIVLPVLEATPGVENVTDVHGKNERGLDVIFFVQSDIERLCYGLQLKRGPISGGGTGNKTVKQIIDQLELASNFEHPVATSAGTFKIQRFVVATSGRISSTAREEIARRLQPMPVVFWDGSEIIRRIHRHLPALLHVSDGPTVGYLSELAARFDGLDTLDQIPGVARRTLSQVYEEPRLRRIFDPTAIAGADGSRGSAIKGLGIVSVGHNCVVIADQDAGKTTLLKMIALRQARSILQGGEDVEPVVPVIVRARDALFSGLSLTESIATALRHAHGSELESTLVADLEAAHYWVAIDGFSELTAEEDKGRLETMIQDFASAFPDVRIVVTARPVDFIQPRWLTDFYHYTIEDFDDAQSASLIRRWTGDATSQGSVASKMVSRLREALQLPGSPIPATIGVMLHEEQGRFVTNTAEAIDRYMVIRLGRYAHELGMRQEIDWARKQDLLAEVAYAMIEKGEEAISVDEFVARISSIQSRQGDSPKGARVAQELVESGVLCREGDRLSFFRSSFRDFFAAHHIRQLDNLDAFAAEALFDRRWGGALVFAAGLRRNNSRLLTDVAKAVERHKNNAIDGRLGDDYFYAAYLSGRILANSESTDHGPKLAALRTTLSATKDSLPELEATLAEQFGGIGNILALLAADHTFFVTVGVPWLKAQLLELLEDQQLGDEERYVIASTYANLGLEEWADALANTIRETTSTRVLLLVKLLLGQILFERGEDAGAAAKLNELERSVNRRLSRRQDEVNALLEIRPIALRLEAERLKRIQNRRT